MQLLQQHLFVYPFNAVNIKFENSFADDGVKKTFFFIPSLFNVSTLFVSICDLVLLITVVQRLRLFPHQN